MKSRVLICGGRDYEEAVLFESVMNSLRHLFAPKLCIIEGGAKGADRLARQWAHTNGVPCLTVEANWEVYGARAGTLRNTWMLEFAMPDLVIAFPGGAGTNNMLMQTRKQGLDIWQAGL